MCGRSEEGRALTPQTKSDTEHHSLPKVQKEANYFPRPFEMALHVQLFASAPRQKKERLPPDPEECRIVGSVRAPNIMDACCTDDVAPTRHDVTCAPGSGGSEPRGAATSSKTIRVGEGYGAAPAGNRRFLKKSLRGIWSAILIPDFDCGPYVACLPVHS